MKAADLITAVQQILDAHPHAQPDITLHTLSGEHTEITVKYNAYEDEVHISENLTDSAPSN